MRLGPKMAFRTFRRVGSNLGPKLSEQGPKLGYRAQNQPLRDNHIRLVKLIGVQGVASSNLAVPTIFFLQLSSLRFWC